MLQLEFLREIKGAINQITHIKQDVANCWNSVEFRFSVTPGMEYVGFELDPNTCQIPTDILNTIQMNLRVLNMSTGNSKVMDLDILEQQESDGF